MTKFVNNTFEIFLRAETSNISFSDCLFHENYFLNSNTLNNKNQFAKQIFIIQNSLLQKNIFNKPGFIFNGDSYEITLELITFKENFNASFLFASINSRINIKGNCYFMNNSFCKLELKLNFSKKNN